MSCQINKALKAKKNTALTKTVGENKSKVIYTPLEAKPKCIDEKVPDSPVKSALQNSDEIPVKSELKSKKTAAPSKKSTKGKGKSKTNGEHKLSTKDPNILRSK